MSEHAGVFERIGKRVDEDIEGVERAVEKEAKVVKTDIDATNGVIHVIDSVILPKDE